MVDVGDFRGVGESEPVPYFYQNLAEAEYVVLTFMYMRLLGSASSASPSRELLPRVGDERPRFFYSLHEG